MAVVLVLARCVQARPTQGRPPIGQDPQHAVTTATTPMPRMSDDAALILLQSL